ncbi:similar to Saccharomyces cerevisiae YLR035C MLH2 Protein involved in the mismatch repair of certain frameshift intermediates and involved in meiotic recombination [Maudiozyma saulgeensis]|uniref:Similar to Saccharomyces cerevisiae YLR035C MLH2 Protein involved in the mismatch repair of certain frameshift intermediates and involved in meiotic recombination n=1 Tax=Maudiozyma saulgeensis TaxID=1789683 RepID=A0A1X7QZZ7_9SACH|nr:similar to Saccharomyces cerevisiae YLR035C MLH2 Protein involved in the mismatch repair of certain frameshift intermediates and involved in meiotic recombination [Kazachstania saulgeensis]
MAIHKIETGSQWKITSGSFIYGPTTAIKELIDNSIDSGAKSIFIDVDSKTGGCDYFSVRDDGVGISEVDRSLLCLNHTTSKITTFDDLQNLSALGFRGEALFMLATLSAEIGSMQIMTRTKDDPIGTKWFVDVNGQVKTDSVSRSSTPPGTTITIRKLLGGLRSRDIEMRSNIRRTLEEIKYMINHYTLDFRNIRFNLSFVSLKKNGTVSTKNLQQSVTTNISKMRALSAILQLRKSVSLNFLEIKSLDINKHISIEMILPRMIINSDVIDYKKTMKFLSVNDRAMSLQLYFGKEVNRTINSIYRDLKLLEPHVWYINFKIDMKIIDINIEPEKNDILLKDNDALLIQIRNCIIKVLEVEFNIKPDSPTKDNENHSDDIIETLSQPFNTSKELSIGYVDDTESTVVQPQEGKEGEGDEELEKKEIFISDPDMGTVSKVEEVDIDEKHDNVIDIKKSIEVVDGANEEEKEEDDDDDWTHTLLEKSPTLDIEIIGSEEDEDIQSSLKYQNDVNIVDHDEDLYLSKDMSLSNPFIIAKMNSSNRTKKKQDFMMQSQVDDTPLNELLSRKRRVSSDTEEKLIELQVKQQNSTKSRPIVNSLVAAKKGRSIRMFSEYTNSQMLQLQYYPNDMTVTKDEEDFKGGKLQSMPSHNICSKLESLFFDRKEKGSLRKCLTVTPSGWYIFNSDTSSK